MQISDLPCPVHGKEDRRMSNPLKSLVAKFGLPRIIIVTFFLFLVAAAVIVFLIAKGTKQPVCFR